LASKLQMNKSGIIPKYKDEKGFVLLGSLVILSLIALVASIALTTTFTDIKISSNYKTSIQSFYIAEAGVQRAKAELRTIPFNDALELDSLFGTDTYFADGTYNVIVEDNEQDDTEDGYPEIDNDGIVYIIGSGFKNGSESNVELKIRKTEIPFPPVPGAITIIGEANVYIYPDDEINVDGRDWLLTDIDEPNGGPAKYAIALSNIGGGVSAQDPAEALQDLANAIILDDNFIGTDTGIYDESIGLVNYDDNDNINMTSKNLHDFVDMAKQVADSSLIASDVPDILPDIELGSVEDPKITYINAEAQDVVFNDDITGSGILIVEGNDLIFNNTLNWIGLVIVIGDDVGGGLLGDDSLEQSITGAFIVDEQDTDIDNELVLQGNVSVRYSSEAVEMAQSLVLDNGAGDINILTWRQILND
jgi:type II secretory pathway pseudopilin PulG